MARTQGGTAMARPQQNALTRKLGNVRAASVVNPLLWLDLLLVIALIALACFPGAAIQALTLMCWLLGGSVVATVLAFGYFGLTDPDRLQTEPHRFAMYSLQQQGRTIDVEARVVQTEPMMNPSLSEDKK
jgi:hypothetical protein